MTADQTREDKLVEYLKRVTGDLVEAKERLRKVEAAAAEPIAVVGMSCRLPGGGDTPARYWQALRDGVDAMADVPADRWNKDDYLDTDPTALGKSYTQRGGFLSDIAGWDAAFFGIPPQEALRIDPQHRLLYELTWEAFEDAGIAAETLRGSRTGMYLGLVDSRQYLQLEAEADGVAAVNDPYLTIGGSASAAAGRLAYHFDLRGPTMTLDAACSSSLVAIDLAVASLRRGDCDYAVVCSSSAIIHPVFFVQFAKMGMLAPDGKAKVFDETGNGYTLGEGGGALVLTRASVAEKAGDRVHAVIRGTAVNSDGRSNGLTAPNKQAQVAVLRTALANAGLKPDDLDFLEAQGTGSSLGDAIEFGALLDVFGDRERAEPLLVGAVKANIGHLIASSGMASMIKSIFAVKHGEVPGNLHLTKPNTVVTLDGPAGTGRPGPAWRAGRAAAGRGERLRLVRHQRARDHRAGPARADRRDGRQAGVAPGHDVRRRRRESACRCRRARRPSRVHGELREHGAGRCRPHTADRSRGAAATAGAGVPRRRGRDRPTAGRHRQRARAGRQAVGRARAHRRHRPHVGRRPRHRTGVQRRARRVRRADRAERDRVRGRLRTRHAASGVGSARRRGARCGRWRARGRLRRRGPRTGRRPRERARAGPWRGAEATGVFRHSNDVGRDVGR
jgi:3-oxoacyl-(acyl-carrier-protein) synthase